MTIKKLEYLVNNNLIKDKNVMNHAKYVLEHYKSICILAGFNIR